jgi:outer membrane immunogenic protein
MAVERIGRQTPTGGVSWMPYFTGGYAWARNTLTFHSEDGLTSKDRETHSGYAIGGGFTYALTHNVSWTAEYLYLGLESKKYSAFVDQDLGVPAGVNFGRLNVSVVRTGLNWRF